MSVRLSRDLRNFKSIATFSNAFSLPGYWDELPAGDYEVYVEEEFAACRTTAIFLTVYGSAATLSVEPICARSPPATWRWRWSCDRTFTLERNCSEAALSPLEDLI
jgi:hypothetical protein